MSLLPFFQWCEHTGIGTVVRDSTWMFPILEVFHILALGFLGGAVLLVDLHILGLRLPGARVRRLVTDAAPVLFWALIVISLSGLLLFLSEATKCYDNPAFWVKMWLFLIALVFTFTVHNRVVSRSDVSAPGASVRGVAVVSLVLWLGVGVAGRGIGFW